MAILRNPLQDEQATLVTVSLVVLAAVAIAMGLAFTRPVLVPLVLAVIVYYLVSPIADLLEMRLRFPRWLSTFFVMLLVAGAIALVALLFLTSVRGLVGSVPQRVAEQVRVADTAARESENERVVVAR